MYRGTILFLLCLSVSVESSQFFSFEKLRSYVKYLNIDELSANDTGNTLWHGLIRDCKKKVTFSCIQKNAYAYLDETFVERDNITVFDGFVMTKNNLDYGTCSKDLNENLVEGSGGNCEDEEDEPKQTRNGRTFGKDPDSPLQEITNALRRKTAKFLATRDYEIQLPQLFFEGATVKLSPREVDESGALVRIDFAQRALQPEGRLAFKKIRKFFREKLMMAFLALLLIIKLIKLKFMFVIPFLFGIGTAKKLFLKLLLFFVPAFAHIFKLCSSYYSSRTKYHHHHHHQIAHHHHHVPVPVHVPTYYDHHDHHPHHEEFEGYDYAHPHIQYRKDMDELKEWGIEPYEDPYDDLGAIPAPGGPVSPAGYSGPYGLNQYAANARPIGPVYQEKQSPTASAYAHNLAYSGYLEDNKYHRRGTIQQPATAGSLPVAASFPVQATVSGSANALPNTLTKTTPAIVKNVYSSLNQVNVRPVGNSVAAQRVSQPVASAKVSGTGSTVLRQPIQNDDEYYKPIIGRLEEIFTHLRFNDEPCRERLVCSMYKNPSLYTPHSNLVSNELSRDPQEIKHSSPNSAFNQKFHRYVTAARLGQDGGDCLRTFPCHINTE